VWDGHQRQYLTAPPMKPMKMNTRLERITFLILIAPCAPHGCKTRTNPRLDLADWSGCFAKKRLN
jgi:hypothetical protein